MANQWDPIDPEDIVDLWVNFGGAKPFLAPEEVIVDHTVEVPTGVITVTSDIDGQMIRWRTGPNDPGRHAIDVHIVTDSDQEYDVTVYLTVSERTIT